MTLFFCLLSPFCTHTLVLKQLLRLPQHTHSHTRSSAQCLGNTRKATLDRIDTQKEDWVSKVARYTFEACFADVQPVWWSKELLGSHGDDVVEREILRKLVVETKSPKNAQPNNNGNCRNEKRSKLVKTGQKYRLGQAVVPAER